MPHIKLTKNWVFLNRYADMLILPMKLITEEGIPLKLSEFEEKVESLCAESRRKLSRGWLVKCADIFLQLKSHWHKYIPLKPNDPMKNIDNFFCCVNSLMEIQLRRLVMRSLEHLLDFLLQYEVSNKLRTSFSSNSIIF